MAVPVDESTAAPEDAPAPASASGEPLWLRLLRRWGTIAVSC